jgi:Stage II sporulation protein E (SpoIIE)
MVSGATSFEWQPLCVPYLAVGLVCLVAVISAGLIRGDRVVRLGLIGTTSAVAPWGLGTAAAICAVEQSTASRLYQLANGPMTLIGPSLMLILLSVSGQLDRYRYYARVAVGIGVVLALVTWLTPLVLADVVKIPSGIWYPRAGALMWLHSMQIVGWPVMGLVIAWRAWPARHRPSMLRYLAVLPAMTMVGAADTLLAYGIGGVYPFAWLPGLMGGLVCLHLMFRTELVRAKGVERSGVVELVSTTIAAGAIAVVVWLVTTRMSVQPVVVALLTAPLWGVALLVTWMSPRSPGPTPANLYEHVLEELAHESSTGAPVAERLSALWGQHAVLTRVRLRLDLEAFDPEVRAWLRGLEAPAMSAEVATMRLGRRRAAVEAMFAASGAAVAVPVIDRGELIAVVEAGQAAPRTLRDAERLFLFDSAQLVGHALTYERLARDAQAAVTSAREVELANVLAAHYRPLQDDERGPWRLAIEHRSSPHPGGVGWSWAPLADGKVAVMIAEAEPRGVAGALVIAALQGAFAARSREASCGAAELLAALRETVETIGRRALVIVLDSQARSMSWASAGHRGAAIVTEHAAELLMDLGELGPYEPGHIEEGTAELPPGALVVLLSSSVMAAPGLRGALAGGYPRGLRLVTQLVELAAGSAAAPERDLLAIELAERA